MTVKEAMEEIKLAQRYASKLREEESERETVDIRIALMLDNYAEMLLDWELGGRLR